jgi:signal transduction histidine kinase
VNIRGLGAVSRRGVAIGAAVLALGLGTGAAAAAGLAAAGTAAATDARALRAAQVRNALDATFQRYGDTMHDLTAAAAAPSADLNAAALNATVRRIAGERLPGEQQVLVLSPGRTVVAARAVDSGMPVVPPEPELSRALDLSRATGRLIATPAHVLPADAGLSPAHRPAGFELVAPVHDDAFGGWVVIAVRAYELLETSLQGAGVTGVAATLVETTPDGRSREVAGWASGGTGYGDADRLDVALAGHAWEIRVRPTTPLLDTTRRLAPALVTGLAVALSVLLAAVVLGLDAARLRARRAAAEAAAGRDRAEQILREREAELAGFTAAAGQNLHAPLHTIAGYTDLLLEDAAPHLDPAARGFLERIGRSTGRMLRVVDELIAYTAAGDAALKLEPVDAQLVALDVAATAALTAADRPSIDVGDLPVVSADADLLRAVLDQLIGNAVKYVRPGTPATVTVSAHELPTGWYRFEVADRGIGVPAGHAERIFQPFHRAPSAEGYPGSGLGLGLAKRIIDRHGGEIGVTGNPGGGSVFWFTLSATGATLSPDDLAALASR